MQNSFLSLVTFFVLSLLFVSAFDSSCAAQQADVNVVGVRVTGEGYGKTSYGAELRPFNWSPGTTVVVLLKQPSGGLVEIDSDKSVISKWIDDKNQNLMGKKPEFGRKVVDIQNDISKDGKAAMIEITTGSIPKQGATSMTIEGELNVSSGSKTKTEKSSVISIKKGTKFELAGLKFKVKSAGKPKWGKNPFSINLNYTGTNDSLKGLKFFSADGKPLKTKDLGTSTSNFNGNISVTKEVSFAAKADKMIVGVETWTDKSVKKIPLKLEVSLGF